MSGQAWRFRNCVALLGSNRWVEFYSYIKITRCHTAVATVDALMGYKNNKESRYDRVHEVGSNQGAWNSRSTQAANISRIIHHP
jgi:hypothetical protein